MRNFLNIFFLALVSKVFFFAAGTALGGQEREAFDRSLILLASPSVTNVMHRLIKDFSKKGNISFSASFNSTKDHVAEIESGEPANIIVTEDLDAMKDLQRKGLLNVFSIHTLAFNKMVLTLPKKHYLQSKVLKTDKSFVKNLKTILNNSLLTITDSESGIAGVFTKQILERLNLWSKAKDKTIKLENSRKVAYLSATSENPAIMYNSDAIGEENLEIINNVPEKLYDKVIYQVAIIADPTADSSSDDAAAFIEFLKSEDAKKIFLDYGFSLK